MLRFFWKISKRSLNSFLRVTRACATTIKDLRQDMNEKFELVDFKIDALNTKIDSVHDKLNTKIDRVEETLSIKIDNVAADLAAHRADTESHQKGYKVSDGK